MNAKFTLAIIALVGIGVFALPSTMSLFAGQHSFYNIDATGNQVPCQKCHGDVKAELGSNGNTNPLLGPITAGPHAAFKCEYCHRIEQGSSSGDNAVAVIPYENATGSLLRFIVIPVSDMEAGNFPDEIAGSQMFVSATGSGTSRNMLNGTKLQFGNGNISAATNDSVLEVAPRNDWQLVKTYSTTTGLPLDTNGSTMNGAIDPSKVTLVATTSRPYYTITFLNAGSKSVNPGSNYHAASLVSCMECHGGEEPTGHYTRVADGTQNGGAADCSNCHYGGGTTLGLKATTLAAGGFGLTTSANDTGANEAHNAWVKTDDGINRFGGEQGKEANNGACVGCHTHVAIDVNFQKGYKLAFDAIEDSNGNYTVSNAAVEGTVKIEIYGNGSGQTFGVGDKSYTWTPTQTLYLNGNGSVITGLSAESSDSAAALTN
jgi:hypothetical protein